MITVLEPLLGSELYDKVLADWTAHTLTGDYATLFTEFVQPITKNEAAAEYIEMSSYTLGNGGLYKHAPDNAEVVDKEEAQFLSGKYHNIAQTYIQRFNKWICKNTVTEYKTSQDEVDASKSLTVRSGWFFGKGSANCDDFSC